jgi:uncharacterized protein (TIGR03083 family)
MNTTTTTWPGPEVVQASIERPTAMRLAQTEYQLVTDAVDALGPEDWSRPTDCTEWDVRQLVAHVAGQANLLSTPWEGARQMRAAQARQQPGQPQVDALTALQIEERQHLEPQDLRAELHRVGPRGARGRRRIPGFLRRRRMPGTEIVNGAPEAWSLGYVTDVILTRDAWMHRLDLARATGQDLVLTADHDGIIVADVVAEWARRHGQPYRLELTGPAGGGWSSGTSGEQIVMDAADYCRVVAGRPGPDGDHPWGLLSTRVPF